MRVVSNWRQVLRHSSAFWLNFVASVLGGLEIVVQAFLDDPPIPRMTFAALALATTIAAGIARFVAQQSISGGKP